MGYRTTVRPLGKREDLVVHGASPFNAEPSRAVLAQAPITAIDAFYVRNHGAVPEPGPTGLRVDGLVERPLELDLEELRDGRFVEYEVVATLQCAGNRREGLIAVRAIPDEAPWGPGATGTAVWRGVRLADVLTAAMPREHATDVAFVGTDLAEEARPPQVYGASIPLRKAWCGEVLLAWAMNGEPLRPEHGAPLRVVVPGYIGARSVKWLARIELRDRPWDGYFQDVAYRLLAPGQVAGPGIGVPLGEVALNAEILAPGDGEQVPSGPVLLRGYAFAGGERRVVRVDVSVNGGWVQAELGEDLGRWAWRTWRHEARLPPGEHRVLARAWDSSGALQPERPESVWNPKGYVNNAWSRVTLRVS